MNNSKRMNGLRTIRPERIAMLAEKYGIPTENLTTEMILRRIVAKEFQLQK